jgi:methyl-accepting chemotaxis protein/hemerythrin
MPLIIWNDKYCVGIDQIDQQHQKLILLLNILYDAMMEGKGKGKLEQLLTELVEYTKYHFKSEEELFEKFSYKGKAVHIKEHNDLREKVMDFSIKIKAGQGVITQDILKFLKAWINNHILSEDKKFALDIASKIK